jgi:hypothetical protein
MKTIVTAESPASAYFGVLKHLGPIDTRIPKEADRLVNPALDSTDPPQNTPPANPAHGAPWQAVRRAGG